MDELLLQPFGYSEMYEWAEIPEEVIGKFVTFSPEHPEKICVFGKNQDDICIGVTTINSLIDSDNPKEWVNKYQRNKFGDYFLEKERLAVGGKVYDENIELSFIRTYPWEHFIKVQNKNFDETKQYTPRVNRPEWVRVNLLGKCIVSDNGECKPGEYCTPYVGKIKPKQGTAVPASESSVHKYYVLARISEDTILIINK